MSKEVVLNGFGSGGSVLNFKESTDYPGCYYRSVDGATEWLNPPMVMGTEYRTVERFQNKPVYAKAINFGALPNATEKKVSSGLTKSCSVRELTFIAYDSNGASLIGDYTDGCSVYLTDNYSMVICNTTNDLSTCSGTVFLKYIK